MVTKKRKVGYPSDWRSRELLRPAEVALILGESISGIYSRIYRGQLPVVRLGKSVRVPRVRLEEILDSMIQQRPAIITRSQRPREIPV